MALTLLLGCAPVAWAQPDSAPPASVEKKDKGASQDGSGKPDESALDPERQVQTRHRIKIGGKRIKYTATAGTVHLKDDKGKARGEVFYVAYTKDRVKDPSTRPITFAFNGGPGSSAVWLQLGTFGPRRVVFPDATAAPPPPYVLEDNEASILDLTDLVFIDPIGTGFSRVVGEGKPEEFQGVAEDVRAVGEFIRLYTARNARWNSPKFLAGESYGTTRAAALVNDLQGQGMFFNGVVLVSSILNFHTASFEAGNDLPFVLFLPSYAAAAWYHGMLQPRPAALVPFLAEVREFARGEYASALMQGARLEPARRARVIQKLATYTGVSTSYLEQTDLRIHVLRYIKELRRQEGKTVGRLDARYVGADVDDAGSTPEYDPSFSAILGPYTAAMNDYLRRELDFDEDRKYEILSRKVNEGWKWSSGPAMGYVNVAEDLGRAMRQNPHLRVFVANGYYDLATPFFATEYTVDHLRVPLAALDQISMGYYESGHMMYLHTPSLVALKADLERFYGEAVTVEEVLEADTDDEEAESKVVGP